MAGGCCGDPSLGNFIADSCGCIGKAIDQSLDRVEKVINQELRNAQKLTNRLNTMVNRGLIEETVHDITDRLRGLEDCVDLGLSTPRSTSDFSFGQTLNCLEGAVDNLITGTVNDVLDTLNPVNISAIADYIDEWGNLLSDLRLPDLLGRTNVQLDVGKALCEGFDASSYEEIMASLVERISANIDGRIDPSSLLGQLLSGATLTQLGQPYVDAFSDMINTVSCLKLKSTLLSDRLRNRSQSGIRGQSPSLLGSGGIFNTSRRSSVSQLLPSGCDAPPPPPASQSGNEEIQEQLDAERLADQVDIFGEGAEGAFAFTPVQKQLEAAQASESEQLAAFTPIHDSQPEPPILVGI